VSRLATSSRGTEILASLRKRFLQAASGSVGLKIFAALAKIAATVVLAQTLGAQGFGVFAYTLSIIAIAGIPFHQGLPNLVARNVAIYHSLTKWSAMRGLLLRANQLVLGLSLLIVGLAAAVALLLDISQTVLYTFIVALALLPCLALSGVRRGALVGLHRPVLAQMPEHVIQPALFIAFVGITLLLIDKANFTPALAMALRVATVVVEFCIGYLLLFRYLPEQIKGCRATFDTSGWLRGAAAFMLIGGMGTINTEIGILMLGMFGSIEEVGVYKGVTVLAGLVTFVLQSFNTALLPFVTKLYTEGDKHRLQQIVTLSCRLVLLCGLPVATVLIFFGEQCLLRLYGDEFSGGATALAILSVGLLLNTATGPVGLLLNASGHEWDTIKGKVIGMVLNIVLGVILIPVWGLEGAAWATTCSLLTWNIILVVLVRRRLNLHSTVFGAVSLRQSTS
jgi:O-antigen/teichoic acid export membrane protein